MLRRALLVTPILLVGCAAPRTNPVLEGDEVSASITATAAAETRAASRAATEVDTALTQNPPMRTQQPPQMPRQRFSLKGGYYGANEDEIDDGVIFLGSWLRPVSGRFSSEVEIGYLDASGSDKGVDRDVWAIPLMGGARYTLPIGQRLEAYVGLGLGSFYYEADVKSFGAKAEVDGFLLAGDGYFGGTLQLGRSMWLGAEGKYYLTDDASNLDGLDAFVGLLTLGFTR